MRKSTVILFALLICPTATTWAMKSSPGLPVSKIHRVSEIDSWRVIDRNHILVSLSASRNYLLTLTGHCHGLSHSRSLGISSSNNTAYAGFDYITADGQRCAIRATSKLSKAEHRAIRGKLK